MSREEFKVDGWYGVHNIVITGKDREWALDKLTVWNEDETSGSVIQGFEDLYELLRDGSKCSDASNG
jgi:hypothetical protein